MRESERSDEQDSDENRPAENQPEDPRRVADAQENEKRDRASDTYESGKL